MKKETFGQRMRRLRMRMNISQDQLAEALKTTRQTVSAWENDKNTIDNYKLIDLKHALCASWEELMDGDNFMTRPSKLIYSNEDNRDYFKNNLAHGHQFTRTNLANLSVAGEYIITKEDLEIYLSTTIFPSHIIAIAKEARLNGLAVLDIERDFINIRFDTDDEAKSFKQFLDDAYLSRYEHQLRFELTEGNFRNKYFDIMTQYRDEGIREAFDIKTDKMYVVIAPNGVKGYAESVEDAQKLAKKLDIKKFDIYER